MLDERIWFLHLGKRSLIGLGVVLHGDLGRHAAHGMDPTPVTRLDEQQAVRAHARLLHCHHTPACMREPPHQQVTPCSNMTVNGNTSDTS